MTVLYSIIQFIFWFSYGTAVNFSSVYLLQCGLTNTMIGMISSVACALSIVLQPVLATYADRNKNISIKSILLVLYGVSAIFGILLVLSGDSHAPAGGLLIGCAILIVQIALPFANALATEMINAGKKLNFSVARGIGSLGYAVMSFSNGKLSAAFGGEIVPMVILVTAVLEMSAIAMFPFEKGNIRRQEEKPGDTDDSSFRSFLRKYPAFIVILAGCVLIFTSHVYINNFVFQIVTYKGGTSEHMGIVMGLAGILEISSMFLFSRLLRWKDSSFWFRISGIFFTLKALGTLLAGTMGALYAVQLIQPFGWGLMIVSSVYFVNDIMESEDKIKGQAYMTMTLSTGTIIGSLSGGWLIDHIGIPGMLIAAVLCGAAGTIIVNLMTGRCPG